LARRRSVQSALDDFGRRVAEIRRAKGWTQERIAERLGMPLRNYQKIEAGLRNITMRTIVAVANAVDVPLHDLFIAPESRSPRHAGRPKAVRAQ
jgi:transcriptional regulator with XRE-family HTH domain